MLHRYDNQTTILIKEILLEGLEKLYTDESIRQMNQGYMLISVLVHLHDYNMDYMKKLIDDAKDNQWRFDALNRSLLDDILLELKDHRVTYQGIINYLQEEMNIAAEKGDDDAYKRLEMLLDDDFKRGNY